MAARRRCRSKGAAGRDSRRKPSRTPARRGALVAEDGFRQGFRRPAGAFSRHNRSSLGETTIPSGDPGAQRRQPRGDSSRLAWPACAGTSNTLAARKA